MSSQALTALAERSGIDPAVVEDVVLGCVGQVGEQTFDIARNAVLGAGLRRSRSPASPSTGSAARLSRRARASPPPGVPARHYDAVVAGGVESMSRVPMGMSAVGKTPFGTGLLERYAGKMPNQGVGAEMIVDRAGFSRTQLDEFSLASHEKAAVAQDEGRFAAEIAAVTAPDGTTVEADEGVRRGGTLDKLAQLKPAFRENGTITAGNSSQISDGAAALLITTSEKAAELGLTPIARVHTAVVIGDDPVITLTGPIPATALALKRSGLSVSDIGVFEVNEAFAPVPSRGSRETGADPARLNPCGGAIALGHPLGGSGARIMTTLVHRMRATGARYGLQTMCEGGGQANATILELL